VTPRPISFYAREIRGHLPAAAFETVPSRLVWLALHLGVIAVGIVAIARGWGGSYRWLLAPFWSLAIGHSFAGCAFVGHETMHGAVVRARRLRYAVGWLCFLPFSLSPRLWVAWHNKVHHGHTMADGIDPDSYPTLADYHRSRVKRVADYFSVGYGRWAGFVTLAIGFTGQSTQMLWRWARTSGELTRREQQLAVLEWLLAVSLWTGLAILVGPLAFLFAFVLPLVVGNFVVIAYILTNHSLSPLTDVNDPLINSLTVTTPRLVARVHLNFGLHVEHHLFPSMSSAYAPLVRAQLLERWPERYQAMPLIEALGRLFVTPRVYAAPTRLRDPRSGVESPTLLPRAVAQVAR
jgi:fatty acid desaturase